MPKTTSKPQESATKVQKSKSLKEWSKTALFKARSEDKKEIKKLAGNLKESKQRWEDLRVKLEQYDSFDAGLVVDDGEIAKYLPTFLGSCGDTVYEIGVHEAMSTYLSKEEIGRILNIAQGGDSKQPWCFLSRKGADVIPNMTRGSLLLLEAFLFRFVLERIFECPLFILRTKDFEADMGIERIVHVLSQNSVKDGKVAARKLLAHNVSSIQKIMNSNHPCVAELTKKEHETYERLAWHFMQQPYGMLIDRNSKPENEIMEDLVELFKEAGQRSRWIYSQHLFVNIFGNAPMDMTWRYRHSEGLATVRPMQEVEDSIVVPEGQSFDIIIRPAIRAYNLDKTVDQARVWVKAEGAVLDTDLQIDSRNVIGAGANHDHTNYNVQANLQEHYNNGKADPFQQPESEKSTQRFPKETKDVETKEAEPSTSAPPMTTASTNAVAAQKQVLTAGNLQLVSMNSPQNKPSNASNSAANRFQKTDVSTTPKSNIQSQPAVSNSASGGQKRKLSTPAATAAPVAAARRTPTAALAPSTKRKASQTNTKSMAIAIDSDSDYSPSESGSTSHKRQPQRPKRVKGPAAKQK